VECNDGVCAKMAGNCHSTPGWCSWKLDGR